MNKFCATTLLFLFLCLTINAAEQPKDAEVKKQDPSITDVYIYLVNKTLSYKSKEVSPQPNDIFRNQLTGYIGGLTCKIIKDPKKADAKDSGLFLTITPKKVTYNTRLKDEKNRSHAITEFAINYKLMSSVNGKWKALGSKNLKYASTEPGIVRQVVADIVYNKFLPIKVKKGPSKEAGYATVKGEVTNKTNQILKEISISAEGVGKAKGMILKTPVVIDLGEIKPGEKKKFSASVPEATSFVGDDKTKLNWKKAFVSEAHFKYKETPEETAARKAAEKKAKADKIIAEKAAKIKAQAEKEGREKAAAEAAAAKKAEEEKRIADEIAAKEAEKKDAEEAEVIYEEKPLFSEEDLKAEESAIQEGDYVTYDEIVEKNQTEEDEATEDAPTGLESAEEE